MYFYLKSFICAGSTTLGIADWTVRLNPDTVHVVPTLIMQLFTSGLQNTRATFEPLHLK